MTVKSVSLLLASLLFAHLNTAFAQTLILKIRVIDDTGTGVESDMFKIDRKNATENVGITDKTGYFEFSEKCISGEKIRAVPVKKVLYWPGEGRCPKVPKSIVVTKILYWKNLEANAKIFEDKRDYGKTAMIYSELSVRALPLSKKLARDNENKAYVAMDKYFHVDNPATLDPNQGKIVMSAELKENIESFQSQNGLKVTGKLDYATMQEAAGIPVRRFIFRGPGLSR